MKRPTLPTALLLMVALYPLHAAASGPALWAAYYAWYETGTGPHGRWRMWINDEGTVAFTGDARGHGKSEKPSDLAD